MALGMFVLLLILLLLGYPVALTLGGVALVFGLLGFGTEFFFLLPLRIWGRMTSFILMAVPLFVFMGIVLERTGVAEDLLENMGVAFHRIRGGMAMALVVVGGLLAASTGIVCATVSAMGIIALPTMLRRGYQKELVAGTICASGTLGQIIPPSIILIILADIMNLSVGELFAGSLLPGGVLIFLYLAYVGIISMVRPQYAPRIPAEELATIRRKGLLLRFLKSLFPPAFLILTVLGSIFFGIASPTEAAAMGAAGALFLGLVKKRLTYETMRYIVTTTTKINCMVFIILVSATCFGLVFRGVGGDHLVRDFLVGVASHVGHGGVLAVVMGTVFFLGFFLDYIEISFIVVPILAPIITEMGFNPLWFAVLFGVNFQTSFMTPPFGFSLF